MSFYFIRPRSRILYLPEVWCLVYGTSLQYFNNASLLFNYANVMMQMQVLLALDDFFLNPD